MTIPSSTTAPARVSWLFARPLRPAVLLAGAASLVLNLMLLVPAVFTLQVFERVFTSRSAETLSMLSLLVLIALALAWAMDLTRARALDLAGATLAQLLQPLALRRMLERRAQPSRATNDGPDALRDVATLRGFIGGAGIVALFDVPWLPLYLGAITLMHPRLGAAAAAGALLLIALGALTDRLTRPGSEAVQRQARTAQRSTAALLRRAEAIVGLGSTGHAVNRAAQVQQQLADAQAQLAARAAGLAASARMLQQGLQAGLLAYGAWLVIADNASPGIMVAASLLLGRALQPAAQLIGGWQKLAQARAAWARLADPSTAAEDTERLPLPAPLGRVTVERLVFAIARDRPALIKGLDLTLAPGDSLGLVGASGSGKSTLVRLLLGLWQPLAGSVRLDGADIARWDRTRLEPHIGYLPQDVELFAGTVAENIARLGAVDAEAVTAAARRAGAHELILRLPQGYDTLLGDGGAALSGGQRQRIALARALYGAPRFVVLDEPDAHLDSEGQAALISALRELKAGGTTVVVVTHRSQVLGALDRVAVLKDGLLDAIGSVVPHLRAVSTPATAATAPAAVAATA